MNENNMDAKWSPKIDCNLSIGKICFQFFFIARRGSLRRKLNFFSLHEV